MAPQKGDYSQLILEVISSRTDTSLILQCLCRKRLGTVVAGKLEQLDIVPLSPKNFKAWSSISYQFLPGE